MFKAEDIQTYYELIDIKNRLLKLSSKLSDQTLSPLMDELYTQIDDYLKG